MKKGNVFSCSRSIDLRNLPPTYSVKKLKYDRVYCIKFMKVGERRCVAAGMKDQIVIIDYPSGAIRNIVRGYSKSAEFIAFVIRIEHFKTMSTNEDLLFAQSTDGIIFCIRNLFNRERVLYQISNYAQCRFGFSGIRTFCKISDQEFVTVTRNETSGRFPVRNALRDNIRIHNVSRTNSRSLSLGRVHSKDVKSLSYWEKKNVLLIACVNVKNNQKKGSIMCLDLTLNKLRNDGKESYNAPGVIYSTKGIVTKSGDSLLITISKVSKQESEIIVWNFENTERIYSFPLRRNCYTLLTSNITSNYVITGDKDGSIKLFYLTTSKTALSKKSEVVNMKRRKIEVVDGDGETDILGYEEDLGVENCEKTVKFHEDSVNDLIWINKEKGVFCTCSSDGWIKFVSTSIASGYFDENDRIDFLLECENLMDDCDVLKIRIFKPIIIVSKVFIE